MLRRVPICALFVAAAFGQNYAISTIAGVGPNLGDGGAASKARFGAVDAIALGPDGSLYIADAAYSQVHKVTNGNMSLFAGTVRGFGGDEGPATSAMLDTPIALAVDTAGNVYIGEAGNHRVRKVTTDGKIHTIAGNGQVAPSPKTGPLPGEGGPATSAPLNTPVGIAIAANGDTIVSDSSNKRIFRITAGNIHTIAGNATVAASVTDQPALPATLSTPQGVATDPQGNIYFAEYDTPMVRMIDPQGNMKRIVGTGSIRDNAVTSGPALSYRLVLPTALARDSAGAIYIAEARRISKYTPASASAQTVAGDLNLSVAVGGTGDGGLPTAAGMYPKSLALGADGSLYLADSIYFFDLRNRVRRVANNVINEFAGGNVPTGKGDKGKATAAELFLPSAIAIDPKGNIYIADTNDNRVRKVTPDGNIDNFAGTGTSGESGDKGQAVAAAMSGPIGLAIDGPGNVYIGEGDRVRIVNPAGVIDTFAGGGSTLAEGVPALTALLFGPGSMAVDSQNNLFVDVLAKVRMISAKDHTVTTVAGSQFVGDSGDGGKATDAEIDDIAGVAVDAQGNLYVADEDNGRVRRVKSGIINTFAGGGTSMADGVKATDAALIVPQGVAVDTAGNVYIADYAGNRIRVVNPAGLIRTIAGNGLAGYSGDGGAATNATLNGPYDVKVDAQGNVYVVDQLNSAIRELTPVAVPPTPVITTVSCEASLLSGGPAAPGERVILGGSALGPNSQVFFDSTPAPVITSSATSATVAVPYEVAGEATSQVTVTTNGVTSAPFALNIVDTAPGVYAVSGGTGQIAATNEDGTPNSAANPAGGDSMITFTATGEGLTSPPSATGVAASDPPPSPAAQVSVTIGGQAAQVASATSVVGALGQIVVQAMVPEGIDTSQPVAVYLTVGNAQSQDGVTLAVAGSAASATPSRHRKLKRDRL